MIGDTMLWGEIGGSTWVHLAIGASITLAVAKLYYQKASKELMDEASELRALTILMLRIIEENGDIKLSRNADGKPVGIIFSRVLRSDVAVSDSFDAKDTRADGRTEE